MGDQGGHDSAFAQPGENASGTLLAVLISSGKMYMGNAKKY